jgi:hypothetical protein
MQDIKDSQKSVDELTRDTGEPASAEHDAWFKRKVQDTLAKKDESGAGYSDFEDIAKEHGL